MDVRLSRRALLSLIAVSPIAARAAAAESTGVRHDLTTPTGRKVAVWSWKARRRIGTIAFSHGALSAPWKYPGVVDRWVAAGFDVHAPLHVDSTDHPNHADYKGLTGWAARIEDMRAVSGHIGREYIAAGHSYGALTALTLGGASAMIPAGIQGPLGDPLVSRVVAFSPPPPIVPLIDRAGYATLDRPALIETGTHDLLPPANQPDSWHGHLAAYDAAAPGGQRYSLVLEDVTHYFGGLICDYSQPGPPTPAALATAVDLSLLFMKSNKIGNRLDTAALDRHLTADGPVQLSTK